MADELFVVGGAVPFDKTTPEQENTYHHYTGNAIPWFIRGIWIAFWCYAITYFVVWLLPALQSELLSPHELVGHDPLVCDYCQSPLPAGWWARSRRTRPMTASRAYCCLGCRMAAAIVEEKGEQGEARRTADPARPVDLLLDERHGLHDGPLDRPTSTRPAIRRPADAA